MKISFPNRKWQEYHWKKVETAAGPRYTAALNVELPIEEVFEGLGRTNIFFTELREKYGKLKETFQSVESLSDNYGNAIISENLKRIKVKGPILLAASSRMTRTRSGQLNLKEIRSLSIKLIDYFRPISKIVYDFEFEENKKREKK